MRRQNFIDPSRTILVGHSAGGWATLAAITNNPAGVVGAINFAGGRGSDAPGRVCEPERLLASAREFGSRTRVPTLWLYAENDKFFGPALARELFSVFTASHHGEDAFVSLPAFGEDGHTLVLDGASLPVWEPAVARFLAKLR
jgi:dienelactone hydrolase